MNEKLKVLVESLFLACRLIEILPDYPDGIKRHYLYILNAIDNLDRPARVTDIAENLLISSPNITVWVNEMEKLSLVERQPSQEDKRVNFITMTEKGANLLEKYYYDYLALIDKELTISDEDLKVTTDTIQELEKVVNISKEKLDNRNQE